MSFLNDLGDGPRPLAIGMIHLGALPGTPAATRSLSEIVTAAAGEAAHYRDAGFDAILVENMHDRPYLKRRAGPEIVAGMTAAAVAAREAFGGPCGVQVLAGANREALAVALAANCEFIRAEGFVFAHVADEGLMESDAGKLLRYRRRIGAEHVAVLADVKKKHASHAVTADVDLAETAKAAEFFLADGIIVTGSATGCPASATDMRTARDATSLPVLVGSGVTVENLPEFAGAADAFIVGSAMKENGAWTGALSPSRLAAFVARLNDQAK